MKTKIIIDRDFQIDRIDTRIYSSFLEHIGRAIYGGIFELGHVHANKNGYRKDVLSLIKDLNITSVRYPGGNYVSGFDWEDSVGPKELRPKRIDLAWFTTESNQFGLHEFVDWCRCANIEPMMCINLGTRGADAARNLIEYSNHPSGSYWSDLRIKNGIHEPMNIKMWCLGNEMDGPWQIGHKTAEEYGRLANEAGKLMKWVDPEIELIACGSSDRHMQTYADWERIVLEECYDTVDYISMHQYYKLTDSGTEDFLARSLDMDDFIREVVSICDSVGAKRRSKKAINLSFDEWNVWYHSKEQDKCLKQGNRRWEQVLPLCEDIYTFEDALLVGCMLITLIKHADRVKIACLAQLVNVIAPIMTKTGGGCLKQTTYFPFLHASEYGRGTALEIKIDSPTYHCADYDEVPYLEAVAVLQDNGDVNVLCVNRNLNEDLTVEIDFREFGNLGCSEHICLVSEDLKASNTFENPEKVKPHIYYDIISEGKNAVVTIKKASWNVLRFVPKTVKL